MTLEIAISIPLCGNKQKKTLQSKGNFIGREGMVIPGSMSVDFNGWNLASMIFCCAVHWLNSLLTKCHTSHKHGGFHNSHSDMFF